MDRVYGFFYCGTETQAIDAASLIADSIQGITLPSGCSWITGERSAMVLEFGVEFTLLDKLVRIGLLQWTDGVVGWSAGLIPFVS